MRQLIVLLGVFLGCSHAWGGERIIDFGRYPLDQTPAGFQSVLSGRGKPGDWRVILDPNGTAAGDASNPGGKAAKVLAQLSEDGTDERFPLLIAGPETYGDFTLTTHFKLVNGLFEQMAGIAFRIQDTNNYYYVRASSLGNTFRFIKLVNGQRLTTVGPSVEVSRGQWHELKVDCKGTRITCLLDGKPLIPPLNDNSFTAGKIGFWTKSDSVSYFGQTTINYTPHETLAQVLVREALDRYPRLVGLTVYALGDGGKDPKVVASSYPDEFGKAGGKVEKDVIARGTTYYGKQKKSALVTLPMHDRNGEIAAAVRVILQSFPGQTEKNAVARAQPIVKEMENRVRTAKDLLQ